MTSVSNEAPVEAAVDVPFSLRLPAEMRARVEAFARSQDKTVSHVLRDAIREHLQRWSTAVEHAMRPSAVLVDVVGADGRRLVRGVSEEYARTLARSITAATGEMFEFRPVRAMTLEETDA